MSKKKGKKSHISNVSSNSGSDKLAAKKAAVLGSPKKKAPVLPIAIVLCAALIAGGVFAYSFKNGKSSKTAAVASNAAETRVQSSPDPVRQTASAEGVSDVVSYPETMFMDGIAKFFEHTHGDITIKYFIMRSVDGVIRAAFDACDVCWPAGKGYVQDGDHMICRNCGRRFASTSINEVEGGCNPAPLDREMKDGAVFIKLEKILEGEGYFDYSQHT